jgi:hypothetical protein
MTSTNNYPAVNHAPNQNQINYAPNSGYPTLNVPHQQNRAAPQYNPNLHPQGHNAPHNYRPPNPAFNQVNYQNPFGHQNANQQVHLQVQTGNQGNNNLEKMVQRNMMLQQLKKNTSSSGMGCVILLAILSITFGVAVTAYIGNSKKDNMQTAVDAFMLKNLLKTNFKLDIVDQIFLLPNYSKDECDRFLAGSISIPALSLFVFGGFNLVALFLACCSMTCMAYLQGLWAAIWGIATLMTMSGNCSGINSLVKLLNNPPVVSWPFYAIMCALSMASVIANCKWGSSITKAEQERKSLTLMAAMA